MHPGLLLLLLLLTQIIQTTWLQVPAFSWIQADLCLVVLLFIAFFRGPFLGLIFGMILGLVLDITTGTFIGGQIFTYSLFGYFAGSFFKMFLNRYLLLFAIALMFSSVTEVFLQYGIHLLFTSPTLLEGISSVNLAPLISTSVQEMIYNTIFGLLLYPLAAKWIPLSKRRSRIEEDA